MPRDRGGTGRTGNKHKKVKFADSASSAINKNATVIRRAAGPSSQVCSPRGHAACAKGYMSLQAAYPAMHGYAPRLLTVCLAQESLSTWCTTPEPQNTLLETKLWQRQ